MESERDLEDVPSSEDDDMDASELRGRLQKLAAQSTGLGPDYTSPIGSPPDEDSVLSAKGRFLELKRMMQEDKKSRKSKKKRGKQAKIRALPPTDDPEVEGFEEIGVTEDDDWEREGSISPASYTTTDDVDQLLESFRSERAAAFGAAGGERDLSSLTLPNNPRMMEVCQQLRERDGNILSLEAKVMELDRQLIDLQDTLSEKDKLLNSKNDAVSCMITQYQEKLLERDTELGRTQEALFQLEKKFGSSQNQWKAEKDGLNSEIKAQSVRIKDLEDTNKMLESSRVEQTSREVELEEKLEVLKQDRDRLTRDNASLEASLERISQEKGALEESLTEKGEIFDKTVAELEASGKKAREEWENKLVKMKKQFALKLKSVKESTAAAAAPVEESQDSAASTAAAVQELQTQLTELQDKLNTKTQELDLLHTQNTALQNELVELKNQLLLQQPSEDESGTDLSLQQISSLEDQIAQLKGQLDEKSLQLSSIEEQFAQILAEKSTLELEKSDFNTRLGEYEANFTRSIEEYEERLEGQQKLEENNQELTKALEKSKEQLNKMKKQFQAKLKTMRESKQGSSQNQGSNSSGGDTTGVVELDAENLQSKVRILEQRVAELEEEKGNNLWISEELAQAKQDLEKETAETFASYQKQIEQLESFQRESIQQLETLSQSHQAQAQAQIERIQELENLRQLHQAQLIEQVSPEDSPRNINFFASTSASATAGDDDGVDGWESQTRITALEHQVATLEEEKGSGFLVEEDVGRLKQERDNLEKEFQAKSLVYEERIQGLEEKLTKSTEQLAKMKRQFQIKLRALRDENAKVSQNKDALLDTSSTSSSPCPETEAQLQEKITHLENRIAELEEEKGNRLLQMIDYDEQQAQLTKEVTHSSPSTSAEDVIQLEITLAQREEELRLLQAQLTELTDALSVKNVEVESLMKTCSDMEASLQQNIEELSSSISTKDDEINSQLAALEGQLSTKEGEIQSLQEKLLDTEMRFEEMKSLVQEYQGMVDGARGHDKEELSSLKLELESIRAQASSAEQSFTSMKEFYSGESSRQVDQITALESALASLSQNYESQTSSLQSLKEKVAKKEADFLSQIETLSSQLASYEQEIESLNQKAAEASTNQDQMQTVDLLEDDGNSSLQKEFEEKERTLVSQLEELRDEVKTKNEAIQGLNWQLENTRVELDALTKSSAASLAPLQGEVDQLRKSLQEYSTYSEGLKAELDNCRGHYTSLEGSYNQIYMEFSQKTAALEQLEGEINSLRAERVEKDGQLSKLQTRLQESESKVSQLNESSSGELSQLQTQITASSAESEALRVKLTTLTAEYIQLRESLEAKDSETTRLRQDADTLQSDYSHSSSELKLHITSLMDQLTEYENEISLSASRLRESDELVGETRARLDQVEASLQEKSLLLEEKVKSLEAAEGTLFEKTEQVLKLEEMLKETGDKHRLELEAHFVKYSDDLETTYDQLAVTASENLVLQGKLREKEDALESIAATSMQTQTMTELESQAKDLRILELENQVRELAVEVGEVNNLRQALAAATEIQQQQHMDGARQIQNLWGQPPPPYEQEQLQSQEQRQDLFGGVTSAEASPQLDSSDKDARIYDLEVQLAELQISLDDANLQLGEVTELKTTLEILSYRIRELEDENSSLKKELVSLKQELDNVSSNLPPPPPPQRSSSEPPPHPQQSTIPVQEPLIVPSTAYVTTDQSTEQSSQLESASKEIKELKVKNGKMIQRFKQFKDKYDAVLKENEGYKTRKEFSLDSAFEEEFMSQVSAKEALLEEKGKLLAELGLENKRLLEKIDLLERGTERLTEMKEEQDRAVQGLSASKRLLETEVSALKWKMEELENISLARVDGGGEQQQPRPIIPSTGENQNQQEGGGYFDMNASNSVEQENSSLRSQNFVLATELENLRGEITSYKTSWDEINERNQQLEEEIEKLQELQIDARVNTPTSPQALQPQPPASAGDNNATNNLQLSLDSQLSSLQLQLAAESQEKVGLQRKIELLQGKISEIEISEIKCFEESLMLKGWTRQLELDNLKIQHELERIYSSIQEGEPGGGGGGIKVKVLQDEVLRLVDALQDRDRRCEQLTVEITRLLEERDTLQLKLSNVLRHNVSLHEEVSKGRGGEGGESPGDGDKSTSSPSSSLSPRDIPSYDKEALKLKLAELEDMNYSMGIDLRREREARRLVQEQLFFSSSSRMYPGGSGNRQSSPVRSSSRPPPPPPVMVTPPTPISSTIPPPPPSTISTPVSAVTPITPITSTPHQQHQQHDHIHHDHHHEHHDHHHHEPQQPHSGGSSSGTFSPSPIYDSPSYDLPFQQPDFQSLTQKQQQQPQDLSATSSFPIQTVADIVQPPQMVQSVPVTPPQKDGSNVPPTPTPSSPPTNPSTQHLFNI